MSAIAPLQGGLKSISKEKPKECETAKFRGYVIHKENQSWYHSYRMQIFIAVN
jgi:hypothetical protein